MTAGRREPNPADASGLQAAEFLHRPHRFGAYVRVDGAQRYVHVPASGRLRELLYPGNTVLIAPGRPGGKTAGRLLFARHGGGWVSVDTQAPTRIAGQLLRAGQLPPFAAYREVRPEYRYGVSRLDFRLDGAPAGTPPCLVEVKSVTLVVDGVALFPDAPTTRGVRHLDELRHAVTAAGLAAAVLFLIQRPDAGELRPHDGNDPAFGAALRRAAAAGVGLYAYRCHIDPPRIAVDTAALVPVRL